MNKIMAALLLFGIVLFGTAPMLATEQTETHRVDSKTVYFPNGYIAYFKEVNDIDTEIDASGLVNGVYDNSVPRKLLYRFEYSFADVYNSKNYYFSSTSTHHIVLSAVLPYGKNGVKYSIENYPTITFYENGLNFKHICLAELMNEIDPYYISAHGIHWLESFYYDYINDQLLLKVVDGQIILIDIYTGDINYQSLVDPFSEIKVGSTIAIVGERYWNMNDQSTKSDYNPGELIPVWVRCIPHTVSQIDGDRVLLGTENGINSWVRKADIIVYKDFHIVNDA